MYLFGLSKEEVLSQKHVLSSCKQVSNMITLFGRQVHPAKRESPIPMKGIDLRLPADHYTYNNFHEASATNWSGKRNRKIVIDLEEPPTTEHMASVSSTILEKSLDLNSTPADDESTPEPRYCFSQDLNCPYVEETETSCEEKSGLDDELPTTPLCSPKRQIKDGTASPASDTSCCTTERNSKIESRRSSSPLPLEPSCRTRLEFPEELSETMQMAAESLVHISAGSYQDQDFLDKPEKGKEEARCCSYDSYELLTLGIVETNTEEDFCVSSKALDELNSIITRDNNKNSKEIGVKLRRGRRMKNFQKEILPSLASLSRHEIREDLNILEAVLRSREYKKMQGKTKDVRFRANPREKRYVGKRRRKHE